MIDDESAPISQRFRGFLPVVVDLETGGFNAATDAVLEMAAVIIDMDEDGTVHPGEKFFFNVEPFEGSNIEAAALEFTGIDPGHPLRLAVPEKKAFAEVFNGVRRELRRTDCQRAIMVAHNASFDQGFVNKAAERNNLKRNPFHPFVLFFGFYLFCVSLNSTTFHITIR